MWKEGTEEYSTWTDLQSLTERAGYCGSVGCVFSWRLGHRFDLHGVHQHSFVEIDHEIFSMVILSLPMIQEGQLSVSGQRISSNMG